MIHEPCFFGLEIMPNLAYKANLTDILELTRATISHDAKENEYARLFLCIDKDEAPIANLNGRDCITAPLNIQIFRGAQITFRVAGQCSVHITGYFIPTPPSQNEVKYAEMNSDSENNSGYSENEEEQQDEQPQEITESTKNTDGVNSN